MIINPNQIICALDFDDFSKAENFITTLNYDIIYKIGMEFFYIFGFEVIKKIININKNIKLFACEEFTFEHYGGQSHEKKFNFLSYLSRCWHYNWSKFALKLLLS